MHPPRSHDIEQRNPTLTANDFDHSSEDRQPLFTRSRRGPGDFGRRKEGVLVLPPAPPWWERVGVAALFNARADAQQVFAQAGHKPKLLSRGNFAAVKQDLVYSVRLMAQEKEILVFASLQWLVIGLAYLLWIQVIDWIPDSVWAEVARAEQEGRDAQAGAASLALWGWSLLVVAVAAYPLALLNAAISSAHYLKASGKPSTVASCLDLAFKNMGRLWLFTAIDAWVTVNAIADRLPKKRGRRTALEEAAYYAWKVATAGVLPSLVAGNGFAMAAKESLRLVEAEPVRAIAIRMAYSLLCWIVGVLAYAGAIATLIAFGGPMTGDNWLYHFYLFMGVPIFVAIGFTSLLRPVFVVAISKLYTDVIPVNLEAGHTIAEPEKVIDVPVIGFVMALGFLLTLYLSS